MAGGDGVIEFSVTGDDLVPTVSEWGVAIMTLLIITAGAVLLQ